MNPSPRHSFWSSLPSPSRRPATPIGDVAPPLVVAPWVVAHEQLGVTTATEVEFVDLTDLVVALVGRHRLHAGLVNVQTCHTTTGVVVNEREPLLLEDFRRTLERLAPRLGGYAHDDFRRRGPVADGERVNGHSHCQALVLPCQAVLNVADGRLQLGRWQRVLLVELDGGQHRRVSVGLVGLADPTDVAGLASRAARAGSRAEG